MQLPAIHLSLQLATNPLEIFGTAGPVQAVVETGAAGAFLVAGRMRVPLPEASGLQAGQQVVIEQARTQQGVELRVRVLPEQAAGPPVAAATGARELVDISRLFDAFAQVLSGEAAAPANQPPQLIRLLYGLLNESTVAANTGNLLGLLDQMAAAGFKPAYSLEPLRALARFLAGDADGFERSLRSASERSGRSIESQIARALETGDVERLRAFLNTDLRSVLARLENDPELSGLLKKPGQLSEFRGWVKGLNERVTAEQLQNLRGLNESYRFFDLAFPADTGMYRAQIHILGQGGQGTRSRGRSGASVSFDLSMSRLGDLWITLQQFNRSCTCHILAMPLYLDAIQAGAPELRDSLGRAGFSDVSVRVEPWDGRRMRQLAALLKRHDSLDVSI